MLTEQQIREHWRKLIFMGAAMAGGLAASAAAMYYWQGLAAAAWYVGLVAMYWGYKTDL